VIKITKKWRMEKAREIIDRNFMHVPFGFDDLTEFSFVCGHEITGAVRKINPEFPNDHRHLHTEIDGVWAARSWRKLITPLSELQRAKTIMRAVIRTDIREYMESAEPQECAQCESVDDLTVDHVAPPFDYIAAAFIEENGIPEIHIPENPFNIIDRFECPDLEAKWIAFHASMACYQILCRSCNASKGKRHVS
jgi:hypothetical protein